MSCSQRSLRTTAIAPVALPGDRTNQEPICSQPALEQHIRQAGLPTIQQALSSRLFKNLLLFNPFCIPFRVWNTLLASLQCTLYDSSCLCRAQVSAQRPAVMSLVSINSSCLPLSSVRTCWRHVPGAQVGLGASWGSDSRRKNLGET